MGGRWVSVAVRESVNAEWGLDCRCGAMGSGDSTPPPQTPNQSTRRHQVPSVLVPALRTVGNIVTGDDSQTQTVINSGALSCLLVLLTSSQKKSIKKEACWTISNITAGTREQIQAVMDAGIIPPLINLLANAGEDGRGRIGCVCEGKGACLRVGGCSSVWLVLWSARCEAPPPVRPSHTQPTSRSNTHTCTHLDHRPLLQSSTSRRRRRGR